jgi:hypothetical protein
MCPAGNADARLRAFDELFCANDPEHPNASVIVFDTHGRQAMRIAGFEEAAKILLEWMDRGGGGNYALYPMIFLLRHCVELELKEAIVGLYTLRGNTSAVPGWVWKKHDLSRLAEEVENGMIETGINFDQTWTIVRSTLNLWELADPGGMFFRFSRDNVGNPVPLPVGVRDHPKNLQAGRIAREGMNAIDWIDGLRTEIGERLQVRAEMRAASGTDS